MALTVACKNDKSMLQEDRSDSASQEVLDARIHRTENGKLQLELNAPIIQKYEKPVAKTIYRSRGDRRVSMTLYENGASVKTYIEAGNAISYDDRDIMEVQYLYRRPSYILHRLDLSGYIRSFRCQW